MFLLFLMLGVGVCIIIGLLCLFPVARDVAWGENSNESGYFDE
jgi:hypothetical protein